MTSMPDLTYRPERDNQVAIMVVSTTLFVAIISLFPGMAGWNYQAVWQSAVLIFSSVAIFFSVRYFLSYRTYSLTYLNGRHVLIVTDTQGRRISTACHVYLDDISHMVFYRRGEEKPPLSDEFQKSSPKKFIFQNVLRPSTMAFVYLIDESGAKVIRLQSDAIFFSALQLRYEAAKAERIANNED